jgi:electron transfer flavoprotein alpha subunit
MRRKCTRPGGSVGTADCRRCATGYSHVLAPSTTFGKDVLPRVAALLGVAQVSDVSAVEGSTCTFKRPIYAGNAIITVQAPADQILVATVRTASYAAAASGSATATVEAISLDVALPGHTRFVELSQGKSDRPDLQSAARVVSGGRALGSRGKLQDHLRAGRQAGRRRGRLARRGGCRLRAERPAGRPDRQDHRAGAVHVAIGISGAIQHLTGIKDAGTIVAINKDAEAPIFEVADIGLVGDLFTPWNLDCAPCSS